MALRNHPFGQVVISRKSVSSSSQEVSDDGGEGRTAAPPDGGVVREQATHHRETLEGHMLFQKTLEKMRKGEGGFTLIELLVVMVIIGLLAAIAIPLFLSQKDKARETALKNDLRNLATYAETYAVDNNGSYLNWNVAAAVTDGFKHSSTLQAGEQAGDGTAANTATTFCVDGTANSQVWSFNSASSPQLGKVACP